MNIKLTRETIVETYKPITVTLTLNSLEEVQRFYSIFYSCGLVSKKLENLLDFRAAHIATQISQLEPNALNLTQHDLVYREFSNI